MRGWAPVTGNITNTRTQNTLLYLLHHFYQHYKAIFTQNAKVFFALPQNYMGKLFLNFLIFCLKWCRQSFQISFFFSRFVNKCPENHRSSDQIIIKLLLKQKFKIFDLDLQPYYCHIEWDKLQSGLYSRPIQSVT